MGKDQKGTEWQTERAGGSTDKGFSVDAKDWVATGGVENPGRSSVLADIQSGGRLPSGQQKTCPSRARPAAWASTRPRSSSRRATGA